MQLFACVCMKESPALSSALLRLRGGEGGPFLNCSSISRPDVYCTSEPACPQSQLARRFGHGPRSRIQLQTMAVNDRERGAHGSNEAALDGQWCQFRTTFADGVAWKMFNKQTLIKKRLAIIISIVSWFKHIQHYRLSKRPQWDENIHFACNRLQNKQQHN